jgi:hypothetical protein
MITCASSGRPPGVRRNAAVDQGDFPVQVTDHFIVMGGEEEGRPEVAVEPFHGFEYVFRILGVEIGRRLVG